MAATSPGPSRTGVVVAGVRPSGSRATAPGTRAPATAHHDPGRAGSEPQGRGQATVARVPTTNLRRGGPEQAAELAEAGRGVGHDRDAARLPDGARGHQQLAAGRDQQRHAVAGAEAGALEDARRPTEDRASRSAQERVPSGPS